MIQETKTMARAFAAAIARPFRSRSTPPASQPATRADLPTAGRPLWANRPMAPVRATYDAARTTTDFENYWVHADAYDADSANNKAVRDTLRQRARYEVHNNGFVDGIAQTYANDLVGLGPRLQMRSSSPAFNALVEDRFTQWQRAINFRRKLWCAAHAKMVDGEAFGVLRTNPNVSDPVKLDWVLYEAEQCQTPALPYRTQPGYIDGIRFDQWGNPIWYDILRKHPGASTSYDGFDLTPEQVAARYVTHWFLLRRPGQHRGVPELASTLNTGAAARRWREATLAAVESAADFSVLLHTTLSPETLQTADPLSTVEIEKRMMTALPMGYSATQMRAEHPNATFETFHRSLVNEQARPKSMPTNKAMCDSSKYNFASGRLDHQTYYLSLDVDRADCNTLVADPIFDVWLDEAIRVYRWLGGDPRAVGPQARRHGWVWPSHQVVDAKADAEANKNNLASGVVSWLETQRSRGVDPEERVRDEAAFYGVSEDEVRAWYRPMTMAAAAPASPPTNEDGEDDDEAPTE